MIASCPDTHYRTRLPDSAATRVGDAPCGRVVQCYCPECAEHHDLEVTRR